MIGTQDFSKCGARASDVPSVAANHNTKTWIPCMLDAGHADGHWSTSGCAGGQVRWADDPWPAHALTSDEQEAQERTGEFDLTDYRAAEGHHEDDDEPDTADCGERG